MLKTYIAILAIAIAFAVVGVESAHAINSAVLQEVGSRGRDCIVGETCDNLGAQFHSIGSRGR